VVEKTGQKIRSLRSTVKSIWNMWFTVGKYSIEKIRQVCLVFS
jgi:hypothetical protein